MDTGNQIHPNTISAAVSKSDFKKIQAVDQNAASQSSTTSVQQEPNNPNGVDNQQQNTLSKEELAKVVKQVNTAFQDEKRSIQFSIDEASGRTVIKVLDSNTGKEIRQFPSEDILELSRKITAQLSKQEDLSGLLVKDRA